MIQRKACSKKSLADTASGLPEGGEGQSVGAALGILGRGLEERQGWGHGSQEAWEGLAAAGCLPASWPGPAAAAPVAATAGAPAAGRAPDEMQPGSAGLAAQSLAVGCLTACQDAAAWVLPILHLHPVRVELICTDVSNSRI